MLVRIADDQFSIGVDSAPYAQSLADFLRESGDWIEVVPGIDSVVVRFDVLQREGGETAERLSKTCSEFQFVPFVEGQIVEVPVRYGGEAGPDLAEICSKLGMSLQDFIDLHTSTTYLVEMVGFTPGFAFIGELPEKLRVPRRVEPRSSVPAGSVAIADSRTGIYAMSSPGGWNIIGRTRLTLFESDADDPFLLSAGMRVRFVVE